MEKKEENKLECRRSGELDPAPPLHHSITPVRWGRSMRLVGKVAIVTGGARHIGAVYCRKLAAEGAAVIIADVLDGDKVVQEITAAGGRAMALKVDVSKQEDTIQM